MEPAPTRSAGDVLGPYTLVALLGEGGMGEVWEAVLDGPAGFRKTVALKVLRAGSMSERALAALQREARLGALLNHPNVVGTWGLSEHDGTWCIALELVRGRSLAALVREHGALPPHAVLDVGTQAAAALAHVHQLEVDGAPAGLVHCDVKPANLLVDRAGLVKLADLGISAVAGEAVHAAGTRGYVPAEQLDGRPAQRSDVFALGATLYRIATGKRPFGAGLEAVAGVRRVERFLAKASFLEPVEAAVPGLAEVVRATLRLDPAERPSAVDLADQLAHLRVRQAPGPRLRDLVGSVAEAPAPPQPTGPTRPAPAGNLRVARDRFVGRDAEIAEIEALARGGERWIVLVGPGGVGKTRLAVEVARRLQPAMPGGAWTFDLSEARQEHELCSAVASVLGVALERGDPVAQVGRVLAGKGRALVVLDNLEQCVGALPGTVGRWLDLAPDATFVGTSRVVPRLAGERAVALGELGPAEAEALLVERVPRALRPEERDGVRDLAVALEGMPLALELTAARLRFLRVADVRARLGLALLSGGGRELPERQRSVAASLRWSWELLGAAARSALAQLASFEGGWSLEAAEAVVDLRFVPRAPSSARPTALDVLGELVDASLVRVDRTTARFSMHPVVREFARAADPDERAAADLRHGRWFAQLGAPEGLRVAARTPDRYRALVAELDNLVAAARRAIERGDGPVAVAALRAVCAVLEREGPAALQVELTTAVAGLPGLADRDRATVEDLCGRALWMAGRCDEARAHHEEALRLNQAAGHRHGVGLAHGGIANTFIDQGRLERALPHLEAALPLFRELGDRSLEGVLTGNLGMLLTHQGRTDEARQRYARALELLRDAGERRFEGIVLGQLAYLEFTLGHSARAGALLEETLAIHREAGSRRSQAIALTNLGSLAAEHGRWAEARERYEEALGVLRDLGDLRVTAGTLVGLSVVNREAGRLAEAAAHAAEGLALARSVSDRRVEGHARIEQGEIARAAGGEEAAALRFGEAAEVLAACGDKRGEGTALVALARVVARTEGPDAAHALLDRAEPLLGHTRDELAVLHALRAEVAHAAGDPERARVALAAATALRPGRRDAVLAVERAAATLRA